MLIVYNELPNNANSLKKLNVIHALMSAIWMPYSPMIQSCACKNGAAMNTKRSRSERLEIVVRVSIPVLRLFF